MTAYGTLPIGEKTALDALRGLLAGLLEQGIVAGVLAPLENHDGFSVHPGLVTDPAHIDVVNPFKAVLPINSARMATLLIERVADDEEHAAPARRIAAVMRPCELRAAVELAKLKQIDLAQLLTIGIDCVGTYELAAMKKALQEGLEEAAPGAALAASRAGEPDPSGDIPYRHACSICETPVAWNAEISIHTIGVQSDTHLLVEAADESWLEKLGLMGGADASAHTKAVEALRAARHERREKELDAYAARMQPGEDGMPGLLLEFQSCQRCHNCTVACPICYCKECLFRTDTMAYEPERYFGWAKRKGAARLPGDIVAFQLTRLSHVTASCVGCGLCTSACPADLPVDTMFQAVARKTQALFEYVPGRSIEDALPGVTYRQEEFVSLGKAPR
jgi:formate dehydrogenase subunit beta